MTIKDKVTDLIDKHPLALAKTMYFFYEAISKSLPGYLASYYKHTLLLAPHQVSILVAARFFALLFGSPVLGSIADRLGKPRNILIVTLLALLATYLIVPIVEPIDGFNCKEHLHHKHPTTNKSLAVPKVSDATKGLYPNHPDPLKGHYHNELMFGLFYSWPFEAWEYEETDSITKKVFVTLLMVTLVGEFFASPSETFIDLYTLQTLKSEKNRFGLQILPGVFGWMIVSTVFMFLQSIRKKSYEEDFCLVGRIVDSTPYLFVVYVMILICLLIALMFKYNVDGRKETNVEDLRCSCSCRNAKCLKAITILISKPAYVAVAVATIFAGFGSATKTLFIYSYIKDLGGSPVLFFAIQAVDFISNVIALVLSPWLLKKCGHVNLIAAGLFVNGITFVTYSMIEDPTLVMIVEPFDGVCNTLIWVSILTYVGSPPQIGAALQGLMHGLYRGLGLAIGYFIVSVFILKYGYLALFIGLGLTYFIVFGAFIVVTNVWSAPSLSDEYTRYSLLLDNPDDVYLSETESEVSTVASLYNNNEVIDTSFLKH